MPIRALSAANHCPLCVLIAGTLLGLLHSSERVSAQEGQRPNILWLTSEDSGPQLGCYGDRYADTPNLDRLAASGMKYLHAWSNAPVCAPARTTIISGMWPTSTGSQHMRSMTRLPDGFEMYPHYLKQAGYYCTNNSKEDYSLEKPRDLWHRSDGRAHWRGRRQDQPFFAVFNFTTTHESQIRKRPHEPVHDPSQVRVPAFHPDLPEVRQDWAQYYDNLTVMDEQAGQILAQLQEDGLAEDTIIFYYGDHGTGMPRGKRWLYETGLRVPLIVHVPEKYRAWAGDRYQPESDNDELVGFIDLAPTVLSLAGAEIPEHFQGRALLGPQAGPAPEYMFGFRDRMDERYDMSRAVRTQRYAYIRNFFPHRPQGQYLEYMFQTPTTVAWKKAFDAGRLSPAQSFFWRPKPAEELYDLEADPDQIRNLAGEPQHAEALAELRGALRAWMLEVRDTGLLTEAEMHRRAGERAPYDMARQRGQFPVEDVYEAADWASRLSAEKPDDFARYAAHRDPAVRYWAHIGQLIRALARQPVNLSAAAEALKGDSASVVRSAAAELLARAGDPSQRQSAIAQLVAEANQRDRSAYEAIHALNSLAHCEPKAAELGEQLQDLPRKSPNAPERANGYVERLLVYFETHVLAE